MADFDNPTSPPPQSSSSSPPPQSSPPPLPAAGKRKDPPATGATSSTGPSPSKRPNIPTAAAAASSGDVQDTATSEPLDVQLDDLEILQRMLEHHKKNAEFPFENPDAMRAFVLPWTIMGIATEEGLKEKMEQLKNKYNSGSQPVEEVEKQEFDLWRKIWGKDHDHDPSGGAVGV